MECQPVQLGMECQHTWSGIECQHALQACNAYALCYLFPSSLHRIFGPFCVTDIAAHLRALSKVTHIYASVVLPRLRSFKTCAGMHGGMCSLFLLRTLGAVLSAVFDVITAAQPCTT